MRNRPNNGDPVLMKFINDEQGATAIEYGLIAALVAVGLIVALSVLGNNLSSQFNYVGKTIGGQSAKIQ